MAEVSFGEWLKRRRGARGWTQKQLAEQINCSISTLRKMEAEERRPSVQTMQRLAETFEIPQEERKAFVRFARGDWQAFSGGETENPWHLSQISLHTNLPTSLTSFIGREKEIDEVVNLLTKYRLVTIVGEGGIGKTRLSLEIGQKLLNDYPNGVWFVALDSLSDPALIPQTVASVFDIREGSSDQPLLERLIYSLHQKTALLIFDNCEHLLEACAQLITTLSANCPGLKFLATSREALGVQGGLTYTTPSLSLPDKQDGRAVNELTQSESVRLFWERALLTLPSLILTNDKTLTIININYLLNGIPLAIELAAARVDILQVNEILEQLKHCLDLLISNNRNVPLKHQSMRASMDWSWGLLKESEQIFMSQLSIFAGGWTLDSAQAICEGNPLELTSSLVRKSLIVVNQESAHETRYHFHEMVRQYVHERLIESGEQENTRVRHLQYFLKLSERAELALRGPTQMEWYALLNDERDNIRSALDWADKTDVEAGLWISGNLWRFWEDIDLREGEKWLRRFLDKPESHHQPQARAKALYAYGMILSHIQPGALRGEVAEECLEIYRTLGDQHGEIDGLILFSLSKEFTNGDTGEDIEYLQQALSLSRSLGDIWRNAVALNSLGWCNNKHKQGITYWKEAIRLFRKAGDLMKVQDLLGTLGLHEMLGGDIESAQKHVNEAMLLSKNSYFKGAMHFLYTLGPLESIKGNFEKARTLLEKSMENAIELGDRNRYLWSHTQLGHIIVQQGKAVDASEIFIETTHEFLKDENIIGVVFSLEGMAGLYAAVGKPERTACLIGWADEMRQKIDDIRPKLEQARVDKIIAACLAKLGEVAFSDAYDEGQKMTLEEAVAYALSEY